MNPNLGALKDIHSPPAISWFPPAPGWYVLTFLLLLLFIIAGKFIHKAMKQYKTRKALIQEFSNIKAKLLKTEDKQKAMGDFSIFLRRMALKSFPREQVAHLQGEEWLLCLDTMMECEIFSKGKGRVLITAPYDKHFSEDVSELFPWVEGWIQKKF